jgi:hypothetical protein
LRDARNHTDAELSRRVVSTVDALAHGRIDAVSQIIADVEGCSGTAQIAGFRLASLVASLVIFTSRNEPDLQGNPGVQEGRGAPSAPGRRSRSLLVMPLEVPDLAGAASLVASEPSLLERSADSPQLASSEDLRMDLAKDLVEAT